MKRLRRYQGFEICRTSAGHLVVLNPGSSRTERADLVELLAAADSLEALFFPTTQHAMAAIDEMVAAHLGRW